MAAPQFERRQSAHLAPQAEHDPRDDRGVVQLDVAEAPAVADVDEELGLDDLDLLVGEVVDLADLVPEVRVDRLAPRAADQRELTLVGFGEPPIEVGLGGRGRDHLVGGGLVGRGAGEESEEVAEKRGNLHGETSEGASGIPCHRGHFDIIKYHKKMILSIILVIKCFTSTYVGFFSREIIYVKTTTLLPSPNLIKS